MNITISQITNGWIIAISSPKGNSAMHVSTFDDVIEQLKEINTPPSNTTILPRG